MKAELKYLCRGFKAALKPDSWNKIQCCDILLIRTANSGVNTYEGKAYHPLLDTIGDRFQKKGLQVQTIIRNTFRLTGCEDYSSPLTFYRCMLKIDIYFCIFYIFKGKNYSINWRKKRLIEHWIAILKKTSPKMIIGILPDEYICHAGSLLKIPVYDLQHGVIDDDHPWYGIRFRKNISKEFLPTGFLCWNDRSVQTISKWAIDKGIDVKEIGNPWFLRFIWPEPEDKLVQKAYFEIEKYKFSKPIILISLQFGLDNPLTKNLTNGVIAKALEKVIIETLNQYDWIIRLHPNQWRDKKVRDKIISYLINIFGSENTNKWIQLSTIPLPLILGIADLHITYNSSVVIESTWMGVRSGVLDPELRNGGVYESYFLDERRCGMVDILDLDSVSIIKWISENLQKEKSDLRLKNNFEHLDKFIVEIEKLTNKV